MPKKSLLQELQESGVDFDTPPASYYSGGLEDPCRIEPDNIIAFFSPVQKVPVSEKWYHQRYQIKCNLGTSTFLGLDDLRFQLPPRSGIVIFPFQIHYFDLSVDRSSRFFLTITFSDRGNGRSSLLPLMNRPFRIGPEDYPLIKTMVCAYQKHPGYQEEDAVHALRLFLSRKLRQSKTDSRTVASSNPFMDEVMKHVRDNYDHPPSIKDLAEMMNLSESHLRLKVRRMFNGISLGKFLHHLRFYHAYELIERTDLPLRTIARKCGYSDVYSFSRAFKKDSGFSPSAFRKKCRSSGSAPPVWDDQGSKNSS